MNATKLSATAKITYSITIQIFGKNEVENKLVKNFVHEVLIYVKINSDFKSNTD